LKLDYQILLCILNLFHLQQKLNTKRKKSEGNGSQHVFYTSFVQALNVR
jgi:hypothetical protein